MKKRDMLSAGFRLVAVLAVSVSGLVYGGVSSVSAATPAATSTANGLKVSPVRTDLTISPGASQTVTMYVQNVTAAPLTLKGIVNDFIASNDENGSPRLILDANQYAPSHSLKRYVGPINNFSLAPQEQKTVTVTVSMPKNAPAGGYYGAVRFAPASSTTDKNVNLTASVGSLILVKVPGNFKEQVTIAGFNVQHGDSKNKFFTSGKDLQTVVRFHNIGDIQEQPFGKIDLKKGGKVVSTIEVNNTDPRGNVLPDSIRKFSVPLNKVGNFGKYEVDGNFGYGGNGELVTAKTTFYVIPYWIIVGAVLAVLIILFVVIGIPRIIRRHDRRVLRGSRR
jgi:hypothetical protein